MAEDQPKPPKELKCGEEKDSSDKSEKDADIGELEAKSERGFIDAHEEKKAFKAKKPSKEEADGSELHVAEVVKDERKTPVDISEKGFLADHEEEKTHKNKESSEEKAKETELRVVERKSSLKNFADPFADDQAAGVEVRTEAGQRPDAGDAENQMALALYGGEERRAGEGGGGQLVLAAYGQERGAGDIDVRQAREGIAADGRTDNVMEEVTNLRRDVAGLSEQFDALQSSTTGALQSSMDEVRGMFVSISRQTQATGQQHQPIHELEGTAHTQKGSNRRQKYDKKHRGRDCIVS